MLRVVTHGDRYVLELKLLLHQPGFSIKMFQDGVEMVNQLKLRDLYCALPLQVREEQILGHERPQLAAYKVDPQVVGSLLLQDPQKDL